MVPVLDAGEYGRSENCSIGGCTPVFDGAGNPSWWTSVSTTDLNGDGSSFGDACGQRRPLYPGESRNDRLPGAAPSAWAYGAAFPSESRAGAARRRVQRFQALSLSGYSNNCITDRYSQGIFLAQR